MVAGRDVAAFDFLWIDIPEEQRRAIFPLHPELLIKIAIVNFAAPADADSVTAHESLDCSRIKIVDQELHVFFKLVVVSQIGSEPRNGKIGDRVKLVEEDAETCGKFAFIIGLELRL